MKPEQAEKTSLRDELIQVAAVALRAVQDLDFGGTKMRAETARTPGYQHAMSLLTNERTRQEERWGDSHHAPVEWLMILLEEVGEMAGGEWVLLHDQGEGDLLQRAANLGQAARRWCRKHEWPDPKHRAIHRAEAREEE